MKVPAEIKVGLFALVGIVILAYATLKVGDQSVVAGGGYQVWTLFDTVVGLRPKAPIEMAGVEVGVVKKISLTPEGRARAILAINQKVRLAVNAKALLRTRGFLGDTYVELTPGDPELPPLKDGDQIIDTELGGDVNTLVNRFNEVADDIRSMTSELRGAPVENLKEFIQVMRDVSVRNEKNFDRIASNLAELTESLKDLVASGREDIRDSMDRIASIAQKIDEGRGTIGRLVNDPETAEKLNEAIDSLNETLGGMPRWELEMGYHTEYLINTKDYKHYVSFGLKPSPDKAFLLDIVGDPAPDTRREQRTSSITVGGTTTNVTTESSVLSRDSVLFSAQIAKKFYDFTLRGGMIESKGGLGLDFDQGPFGLAFSAFDFETKFNEKPHLKLLGSLNLTKNLFLVGGADDPLNPTQKTDYFFGGGFRLVDEDIKSLLSLGRFAK